MNRIAIVGCSGGGKSTLARTLGERLALPVVHLDSLFWRPGWQESDLDTFRQAVARTAAGERWISDGNFVSVADLQLSRADTIVWIDRSRLVCLWRAVWRALITLGRTRPELAPGCPERFDVVAFRCILNWNHVERPQLQRAINDFGHQARLVRLRSDRQVAAWIEAATRSKTAA